MSAPTTQLRNPPSAPASAPASSAVSAAPARSRAHTFASRSVTDFPPLTGMEEEWRFTPLRRLRGLAEATDSPGPAAPTAPGPAAPTGSGSAGPIEYGYDTPSDGIGVCLGDRNDPRVGSALVPFDRISALAFGQVDRALVVTVEPDAAPDSPLTVRVTGTDATRFGFGHTVLDIGARASATIVVEHTGSVTLADNVEVLVGDGASLTLVSVADWSADAVQAQHMRFRLGRDASVTHIQVTLGGDLVRQYTSVDYAGRGASADLYGVYVAGAGQHLEHRLLVDHAVPDCRSNVVYRGALQGEAAHTVWVGDVLIRAEATGTDTYEVNRNLILSDGARADSVPNLEIETGEVIGAGHASTTGRFDDEQLFYLMARGIPEEEARTLVVRGFFADSISKIPIDELRERLGLAIDARLAGRRPAEVRR